MLRTGVCLVKDTWIQFHCLVVQLLYWQVVCAHPLATCWHIKPIASLSLMLSPVISESITSMRHQVSVCFKVLTSVPLPYHIHPPQGLIPR